MPVLFTRERGSSTPCLSALVGAVQRLAMSEASPLYKKLTEEEKAGYVKLAEGKPAHQSENAFGWAILGPFHLRGPIQTSNLTNE